MSGSRGLVTEALEALVVHSATAFSWLGQRFARDDPGSRDDDLDALRRAIEARLYADFYLAGRVATPRGVPDPYTGPWPSPAVRDLSSANSGAGSPQDGWIVVAHEDDMVVVEREGLRLWAERGRCRPAGRGVGVGDRVALVMPKESIERPGGFYVALGDAGRGTSGPVDRFYWNVRPQGRAALVGAVTAGLNGRAVPFRFKVLSDPRVSRCDAAVLYAPAGRRPDVLASLPEILAAAARRLRAATPVFTSALAPGLGFAEHPPGGESFGTHRCTLLAAAAVRGHLEGAVGTGERLALVESAFAEAGISLDRPHLNPGSDPASDPTALAA